MVGQRSKVRISQGLGQKLMARITYAAKIDLRFSNLACQRLDFYVGPRSGNFARKCFDLVGQPRIRPNGSAQRVAQSVLPCASKDGPKTTHGQCSLVNSRGWP